MFKEWLTPIEIHCLNLPGMPKSTRGVDFYCARVRDGGPKHLRKGPDRPTNGSKWHAGPGHGSSYHYTCLPPEAIAAYEARHRPTQDSRVDGHLGTVLLNLANDGLLRGYILQQMALQPNISASRIRDLCLERFGANVLVKAGGVSASVRMPPLSAFRELLQLSRQPENL